MIQRKQTLFLLLALACVIVCLCLPVATLESKAMGEGVRWYSLGLYSGRGFDPHPLPFVDLVVVGSLTLISIFLYRRRPVQMALCTANIVLCLAWYAAFAGYWFLGSVDSASTSLRVHFAFCLPLVAVVLLVLARAGVKADEKLVRSMDRIR